jgi:hypothetical protein
MDQGNKTFVYNNNGHDTCSNANVIQEQPSLHSPYGVNAACNCTNNLFANDNIPVLPATAPMTLLRLMDTMV